MGADRESLRYDTDLSTQVSMDLRRGLTLRPGARVDQFEVVSLIAEGGMGEVYLARDTTLGRRVALKVIQPEAIGPEAIQRFKFEARTTARFNHPHIVTIFAVGEHLGWPYVALEYLEGEDLRTRLEGGRVPLADITAIGLAIAEALGEAHAHDVLHRDLKPENVFLPEDGRLRVVDFGLARYVSGDDPARAPEAKAGIPKSDVGQLSSMHSNAGAKGTAQYMAPEQWLDEGVGTAADVWALGVILFELCAGELPFRGAISDIARRVLDDEPAPNLRLVAPDVPEPLAAVVEACLDKRPSARPTARDLGSRLADLVAVRPRSRTAAVQQTPYRGLAPFAERHAEGLVGRAVDAEALADLLESAPIVTLVGPTACGKTSFIHAALAPLLRQRGSVSLVTVRPTSLPFLTLAMQLLQPDASQDAANLAFGNTTSDAVDELAGALRASPERLGNALRQLAQSRETRVVLAIDQAEELFTAVDDDATRATYFRSLLMAAVDPNAPVRILLCVREDCLDRLAELPGAHEATRAAFALQRPDTPMLVEALTRPLESTGFSFEDDKLPEEIAAAAVGESAALALLQLVAQKLWERRDRARLVVRRAAYTELGGLAGAIVQHADTTLSRLVTAERASAVTLLVRLVTTRRARKHVARDALLDGLDSEAEAVLERLLESRIVGAAPPTHNSSAMPMLGLTHPALTTWPVLVNWLEEHAGAHSLRNDIEQAAELWHRHGKRPEQLWSGALLAGALATLDDPELPDAARVFLDASRNGRHAPASRMPWVLVGMLVTLATLFALFALRGRLGLG